MAKFTRSRTLATIAIEIPAACILLLLSIHVMANALMRHFFNAPIDRTLEVVQHWYMPILVLLGIVAATLRAQHIAADLWYARLPAQGQRIVRLLTQLVIMAVSIGFAWFGLREAMHAQDIGRTALVSQLTIWPVMFMVPFAFGLIALLTLIQLVRRSPDDEI